jgi:3-oxoacyl-[acyl-carrier protein] reductase
MNAIIVTGGTRGIGRAIVDALVDRLLAKEPDLGDAQLVVTYRSEKAHAEALAAALRSKRVVADVLAMDLASGESIDAFVGQMRENYGAVRALINNAGATYDGSFLSMSDEGMGKLIESNLSGTIRLTEGLLPLLRAANPAAVVFIASAAGVYGKAGQVPYATTKGGLIGYTQLLARRCVRQNIFVNAVAPGFIATDMVAKLDPIMYEPILHNAALQKMGTPEDVAHVVNGLLKPGYVQATTIKVDGGHLR